MHKILYFFLNFVRPLFVLFSTFVSMRECSYRCFRCRGAVLAVAAAGRAAHTVNGAAWLVVGAASRVYGTAKRWSGNGSGKDGRVEREPRVSFRLLPQWRRELKSSTWRRLKAQGRWIEATGSVGHLNWSSKKTLQNVYQQTSVAWAIQAICGILDWNDP